VQLKMALSHKDTMIMIHLLVDDGYLKLWQQKNERIQFEIQQTKQVDQNGEMLLHRKF